MMSDAVGRQYGTSNEEIQEYWPKVEASLQGLEAKMKNGDLPFYNLADDQEVLIKIEDYASKAQSKFKNVVVLGIGGSALGPIALREALKPLLWNELPEDKRNGLKLFVPDNPDPELIQSVLDICDPSETLYNVITKSGGTAETMAEFMVFMTQIKSVLGDNYKDHLVFTTDPAKGNLRKIARDEGVTTFSIPSLVGGRFSVLTPVGLLPAALIGIDIRKIMAGVAEQRERVFNRNWEENPSAIFALIQFLAQKQRGQNIHVMMPYSSALFRTADWFRQLWAESLGKRENLKGESVNVGPTPVAALGSTDQHSQVQLYVEGPNDKTFTFIIPEKYRNSVHCGKHFPDLEGIDYLSGRDIGDLMKAEAEATQRALTAARRPNMAFLLDEISPENVGGLMYLLEAATLVAGGLYDVNPLDQPGVEAGKIATYALMGRLGYDDVLRDIESERERKSIIL